ncbi:transposase [Chryseobacterium salipaludis]|uniref:transposase n=1 Tax=Chryseobacterium TaxID=59732 RepID=UPI001FF22208|nr:MULTISPECIES: transposase [Chryseobacterium]MCJ8498832.1 transposase [Chryseobacterium salipaludis]MCX3297770.1 transposase [Planobacterium sp. JC490]
MKNSLFAAIFCISSLVFGQSGFDELSREIETIKTEIKTLKAEIQSVQSENHYLKNVLQINKPVLEVEADHSVYRITQVEGNRKAHTVTVHLLVETENENKTSFLQDFSAVDPLGNEYKMDYLASSNTNPKLSLHTPMACGLL